MKQSSGQKNISKVSGNKPIKLLVLFTFKMRLTEWINLGIVDREMGYYDKFPDNYKIDYLTYDNTISTNNVKSRFSFLYNKYHLNPFIYSILVPFLFYKEIKEYNIIKTNQFSGAWVGCLIKLISRKKISVLRGGYIWGEKDIEGGGIINNLKKYIIKCLNKWSLNFADKTFLTSQRDLNYLKSIYKKNGFSRKVTFITNSIDLNKYQYRDFIERFDSKELKIISIGRLVEMKNIQSNLAGLAKLPIKIKYTILGSGPFKQYLEDLSNKLNINAQFLDNVPNDQIPDYLSDNYILLHTQNYGSGISKVMLEAMACGLIVVASKIPPHEILVKDGITGFICDTTPESINKAIKRVLSTNKYSLRDISENALTLIQREYCMSTMVKKECKIYEKLLAKSI